MDGVAHQPVLELTFSGKHLQPKRNQLLIGPKLESRVFPTTRVAKLEAMPQYRPRRLCLLFIHPPAPWVEVSPAARNTLDSARIPRASKLLICGLFQKGRVLAQDGKRTYGAASEALPQETGRNR